MGKRYIKCPRCELNYILEGEDYCNVCKNEMKHHAETDDDELLDYEDMELCPVCGQNYIREDESMCDECKGKGSEDGASKDKNWKEDERLNPDNDVDEDEDDDDYNSGFGEVDENGNEIDPFKEGSSLLDDDVPIDFAGEDEEMEEVEEEVESVEDDFEVVDVSDDDDDEDDDEDDDYDFEDDDLLGKRK